MHDVCRHSLYSLPRWQWQALRWQASGAWRGEACHSSKGQWSKRKKQDFNDMSAKITVSPLNMWHLCDLQHRKCQLITGWLNDTWLEGQLKGCNSNYCVGTFRTIQSMINQVTLSDFISNYNTLLSIIIAHTIHHQMVFYMKDSCSVATLALCL